MLIRIDLQHFKCFTSLNLPLCQLTLLSGANASGKSSVLQALVLLHQTMKENEWSSRLMLNGAAIQLGTVADVVDQVHGRRFQGFRTCEIGLLDGDEASFQWGFAGEPDEMSMAVTQVKVDGVDGLDMEESMSPRISLPLDRPISEPLHFLLPHRQPLPSGVESLTNCLRGLAYQTAERLGPRETYPLEDPQDTSVVGPRGEQAVSVLYSRSDEHVLDGLAIADVPPTLLRQVEARMSKFFPGCQLVVEKVSRTNAVTLGIRTSRSTEFHRPIHTGFGLTQVFPIVVSTLSADKGGLLLIENPEVHLHPAGQATMGEFLAEVAAAGVQIILETHSDHVLNGIRRAVKNGILAPDDAALHFFRLQQDIEHESAALVESPILDRGGNLDRWPKGFFDQFDKDMNYFAGWG